MEGARKAIFWGGFWCGVLDITSAVVAWNFLGVSPMRIFQSVAGGLLGREAARQGGWPTAILGLACHFTIAFTAAAVFWIASRKLKFLTEHYIVSGLIYGELVFLFMNMVVLPLSALHTPVLRWTEFSPWPFLVTGPVGHPFFVGLPIAIAVHRFATRKRSLATAGF